MTKLRFLDFSRGSTYIYRENGSFMGQRPALFNQDDLVALRTKKVSIPLRRDSLAVHREDLLADWALAVDGQTPFPIDPLP